MLKFNYLALRRVALSSQVIRLGLERMCVNNTMCALKCKTFMNYAYVNMRMYVHTYVDKF